MILPPVKKIPLLNEWKRRLEAADRMNWKRNQDLDIADSRIILYADDGSKYELKVKNDGTLTTKAL